MEHAKMSERNRQQFDAMPPEKRAAIEAILARTNTPERRAREAADREAWEREVRDDGTVAMKTYHFRMYLDAVSEVTPELAEALREAGCSDATPGSLGGVAYLDFVREAESLREANGSAFRAVQRAGFTVTRGTIGRAT